MAGTDASIADAEGVAVPVSSKDGPVLCMMNKRLRALKKKYNRILQIEESKSYGKTINKEQEEVLKTKIAVAALINEYEKLRKPLALAVKEELDEREKELMAASLRRDEEEESVAEEKETEAHEGGLKEAREVSSEEVRKDMDGQDPAVCNGTWGSKDRDTSASHPDDIDRVKEEAEGGFQSHVPSDRHIADLLKLLYFAQLFDVKSQREASSLVWSKVHERSSCLSYDFVTEDSTNPLLEGDLDALSLFGSLVTSRPPNATLSHRDALQQCIEHAILWVQNSDRPIRPDLGLTYSHLRERLNRILSSEYFTMTPELQTVSQQTAAAAATAAGQYASHMLMHETSAGVGALNSEGSSMYFSRQDPASAQQLLFQTGEHYTSTQLTINNRLEALEGRMTENSPAPYIPDSTTLDEIPKLGGQVDADETCHEAAHSVSEVVGGGQIASSTHSPQNEELQDPEEQQLQSHVSQVSVGPRGYQGPKGGGRGLGYGASGRGRGYMNGRGRGGRGVYANGRNGQYYEQGGYYSRNYYGRGGGRSARGGGPLYNGHANGQFTSATTSTL